MDRYAMIALDGALGALAHILPELLSLPGVQDTTVLHAGGS